MAADENLSKKEQEKEASKKAVHTGLKAAATAYTGSAEAGKAVDALSNAPTLF